MKVADLMNRAARAVRPHQLLSEAAQIMWDADCGWLPVIDENQEVVGVITDRDLCMAAYTRGRRLDEIAVAGTMVTNVFSCKADEALSVAVLIMRDQKVRRVPVVDDDGKLVGLVSLSDVAQHARAHGGLEDVGVTLAAICKPRAAPASAD